MLKIHPVLLAGGLGARLWPLSRKSYPKQFSKLIGGGTLFQDSAQRLTSSDIITFDRHITVTNSDFRFIIVEQLQELGVDPGPILIEPEAKNTAGAILAASIFAHEKDKDAVVLVAPSDHLIPDVNDFHEAVRVGLSYLNEGKIVTFGIKPTHPETGYGYLEFSKDIRKCSGALIVKSFIEKPNFDCAAQMLADGNFLWNSGIFLFRANDMISIFRTHSPEMLDLVSKAVVDAETDLGFLRLAAAPWSMVENISIDYAIMEKVQNLVVVPYHSKWSDLGGWDAVWAEGSPDPFGNVVSETGRAIDCTDCLLRSESGSQQVVGIGLEQIIAIAMSDAVLIVRKDRAQDVKKAVEMLRAENIQQAENFPKDHRPWGWFESLVVGDCFQVKRINVRPGAGISLQSHKHRSEHWVVVEGNAEVTIDTSIKVVKAGESVFVPKGAVHRMKNPGSEPLVLIEVQLGTYLGEDDIIRYEDLYARS